jgi:hypothetical protein
MSDVTLQFRSTVAGDDGHWTTSTFSNSATTFNYGNVGGVYNSFMLFKDVIIPTGATIVSAYLRLRVNLDYGVPYVNIYANNTVNPVAPTNKEQGEALLLTDAVASDTDAIVSDYVSVNISSIIKHIVDMSGWTPGKNIMLVAKPTGTTNNGLNIHSFNNGKVNTPVLEVTWTLPANWQLLNSGVSADDGRAGSYGDYTPDFDSNTDHLHIGTYTWWSYGYGYIEQHSFLRFPSVPIVNATEMAHAYLVLTTKTAHAHAKTLVKFNDVANAIAPISEGKVAALVRTTGIVWNDALQLAGRIYPSPNLSTELQTIVDKAEWVYGNAVQLIIDGTGTGDTGSGYAEAYSYDKGSMYPLLLIAASTIEPEITAVSPESGYVGDEIVISGDHFDLVAENNSVIFHTTATVVRRATRKRLYVDVPSGATTGKVYVETSNGIGVSPNDFTVLVHPPAPVIFNGRISMVM